MSEWILLSERKPEIEKCVACGFECGGVNSVLVLYKPGVIEAGSRYQVSNTAYLNNPNNNLSAITHWMPLPALPKGFE